MKIAYTLGSLNRGGTETLLLDVIQNNNINPSILIYRKPGELEKDFLKEHISAYLLKSKNVFIHISQLRNLLKINSIEIVHAHQPLDALYAIFANIGTKRKTVLSIHGFEFHESIIFKCLLRLILHLTSINIFVSNFQKKHYTKKYNLNDLYQTVIHNGINFDKIKVKKSLSKVNHLKSELNLHLDTLLLGSVGNFVPGRSQLFLCHFVKSLKANHVNFHFVFIGKKSMKYPHLFDNCLNYCQENELSKNVTFLGTRNDVSEILQNLDGFFYASDHDTFGIAVIEAVASGIPVFVNDMETMLEITDNGNLANMYKSNDVNDLFAIFEKYLSDVDSFKVQAQMNAQIVRKKYAIQNHIANLNQVYNSL